MALPSVSQGKSDLAFPEIEGVVFSHNVPVWETEIVNALKHKFDILDDYTAPQVHSSHEYPEPAAQPTFQPPIHAWKHSNLCTLLQGGTFRSL